jgi:hypothetical protein
MDPLGVILAIGGVALVAWLAYAKSGESRSERRIAPSFEPRGESRAKPGADREPGPAPTAPVEWRDYAVPKVTVKAKLPDMPDRRPATEAQAAAVIRLGLDVEALTFGQANAVLSARDYAENLIDRTARIEPAASRMLLIQWLVEDADRIAYVIDWSWRTRNHDVRRLPRDAFRAAAERFLAGT